MLISVFRIDRKGIALGVKGLLSKFLPKKKNKNNPSPTYH